ncbi:MAG: hypothetical protein ACOX20_06405 [Limnochordia bacterium]
MRTAGSHGIFDCIAIGPTGIRLIQVKRVKKGNSWQGEYKDSKEQIDSLPRFPFGELRVLGLGGQYWVDSQGGAVIGKEASLTAMGVPGGAITVAALYISTHGRHG